MVHLGKHEHKDSLHWMHCLASTPRLDDALVPSLLGSGLRKLTLLSQGFMVSSFIFLLMQMCLGFPSSQICCETIACVQIVQPSCKSNHDLAAQLDVASSNRS